MAVEISQDIHYIGKILPDGYLEVPKAVIKQMDLKHGDEVEVALRKTTSAPGSTPEEAQTLIQELVGTPQGLKEAVEALTVIATAQMPPKK